MCRFNDLGFGSWRIRQAKGAFRRGTFALDLGTLSAVNERPISTRCTFDASFGSMSIPHENQTIGQATAPATAQRGPKRSPRAPGGTQRPLIGGARHRAVPLASSS